MNGLSPEGTSLDTSGDPQPGSTRTAQPLVDSAQGSRTQDEAHETTGEIEAPTSTGAPEEVSQLEALLATRTRDLQGQRAEVARIRALLRDAVDRFDASVAAAAEQVAAELRRERDLAAARALEAEAARADIRFRLDEVMGHLAAAGAAEGALPGERLDVTCARLSGTVRGLVSALTETQEAYETAQARLLLAEQDLSDQRAQARALERELAEAREQVELEQIKVQRLKDTLRDTVDGRSAGVLRGERDGLRARNDEAERAFAALSARTAELEQKVAREIDSRAEAGSALAGAQAERVVLLEELGRARAEATAARKALETSEAERSRAQQHRSALREAREQWTALADDLRAVLQQATDDVSETGVPTYIEAVEGLEVQLAASEERARQLEARLASAAATVGGLEASAPTPGLAEQLATLRRLLERR